MINHRGKFLLTNNLAGGDVLDGAGKTRGLSIYGEAGMADWIDQFLSLEMPQNPSFPRETFVFFLNVSEKVQFLTFFQKQILDIFVWYL